MASCQLGKPAELICNQKIHENKFGDTISGMAQQTMKTRGRKYNQQGHEQGSHTLVSYQSQCHSQTIMHQQAIPWNEKINHHQTAHAAANSQTHSTSLINHQPIHFNEKINSHQTAHPAKNSHSQCTSLMHHQTMHFNEMAHNHQTAHDSMFSQSHSMPPMHYQSIHLNDKIHNNHTGHAATNFQHHFPSLMPRQPIGCNDQIHNYQTAHSQSHCTCLVQGQHVAHQNYHGTACHGKNDKGFKEKISEGKEIVKSVIKKKYRESQCHDNSSSSYNENEGCFSKEKK